MRRVVGIVAALVLLAGCGGSDDGTKPPPPASTRTWEMGFYTTAPRFGSVPLAVANLDSLAVRSELVMLHEELPWARLLDSATNMTAILDAKAGLIDYARAKGLHLFFMADLTDGLARAEQPPALRDLGRSITEPLVQQRYRDYVLAFVQRFGPEWIGLTAETNLVRAAAPDSVYAAMVAAVNAAAADLAAAGVTTPLLVSVQVETAWGRLGGTGPYAGVEQDFADFPFIDALGLSSYPYFGYGQPEDLPDDYYSRLLNGRTLPVMVCEGGWSSEGVGTIPSSPELQARYLVRQADLLDSVGAQAVVQTLFTDIDLASVPEPYPANLPLFVTLGLMRLDGDAFVAKPALAAWDELHTRPMP